jgi:hypothetical protein
MYLAEQLMDKWEPVLEHKDLENIQNAHRKRVTAIVLENTEQALRESGSHNKGMLAEAGVPTHRHLRLATVLLTFSILFLSVLFVVRCLTLSLMTFAAFSQ